MNELQEDWHESLDISGLQFGLRLMGAFAANECEPLTASELFPENFLGYTCPAHYWAFMIHECKMAELRSRELWHEFDGSMQLHCRDVGKPIADAYQQWAKQSEIPVL